jgi:alpha-L-arabinofuranosidase
MKNFFLLIALLWACLINAQVNVSIDVANVLKPLNGYESGINFDYLMDDAYLTPSTPMTTSIQNLGTKLLRYPGGEKSDNYLWSAAPWTSASPRMALTDAAYYWPTGDSKFVDQTSTEKLCKSNVLDFDELMTICTATGAKPLIVVAYDAMYNTSPGTGKPTKAQLITNATEWVRYANVTKGYDIKYWMIGNESWSSPTYNGSTTPAQYALDIVDFASAMKAVDPSIKIIVNGRNNWWQTLLQSSAASYIDILGISAYPVYNYPGGYDYYRANNVNLTGEIDAAINAINTYALPADQARIKVLATEFNSIDWDDAWTNDNNLGHALCNFQMFGDMLIKPKMESMCLWNTRWVNNATADQHIYDALDKNGNLNAIGTAQAVWGKNLLSSMVSSTSSDDFVRTYASYDATSKNLNIFILNKDASSKTVNLSINNYVTGYGGSKWIFEGTSTDDKFPQFTLSDVGDASYFSSVTIPATSVTILKLSEGFTILPAQLNLSGRLVNNNVQLNWKAVNEKNISKYLIERSIQQSDYRKIGLIDVEGKSISAQHNFNDNIFDKGNHQYRIKTIYQNGTVSYSNIVSISPKPVTHLNASVNPNPTTDKIIVTISSTRQNTAVINVFDMAGKLMYSTRKNLYEGTNVIELNPDSLQKGIYSLQITTVDETRKLQFLRI